MSAGVDKHGLESLAVDHGGECANARYFQIIHSIAGRNIEPPSLRIIGWIHKFQHDFRRWECHAVQLKVAGSALCRCSLRWSLRAMMSHYLPRCAPTATPFQGCVPDQPSLHDRKCTTAAYDYRKLPDQSTKAFINRDFDQRDNPRRDPHAGLGQNQCIAEVLEVRRPCRQCARRMDQDWITRMNNWSRAAPGFWQDSGKSCKRKTRRFDVPPRHECRWQGFNLCGKKWTTTSRK